VTKISGIVWRTLRDVQFVTCICHKPTHARANAWEKESAYRKREVLKNTPRPHS